MGTIRKESSFTTIAGYAGAVLGFVNKILLLPNFFDPDQVGLVNVSVNTAMTFAQLSLLGFSNVAIKYFPFFEDRKNGHHGFLFLGFLFGGLGFLLFTSIFLLFREPLLDHLSKNSPMLVDRYYLIFIIGFFFLVFNISANYLRSLHKTFVASLIRDFFLRLMVTATVTLYILKVIDFEQFVLVFTLANVSISVMIIVYMGWLKQLFVRPRISRKLRAKMGEISGYALFAIFSTFSYFVTSTADSLMLADMVDLGQAGIYTTVMYLASFMLFPLRALVNASVPKVAKDLKDKDYVSIHKLYKRVSFLLLIIGLFIFMGIWINRYNIFAMMRPEFSAGMLALFFLLLSRLVDMVTGLNNVIFLTSDKYRYDLLFGVILLTLVITTNLIFIEKYQATGAAIATLISLSTFHFIRVGFLYLSYKIHPFSMKMLGPLLITGLAYGVDYLLPRLHPVILDIAVRSGIFVLIFGGLLLSFRVSEDINRMSAMVLGRLGIRVNWGGRKEKKP